MKMPTFSWAHTTVFLSWWNQIITRFLHGSSLVPPSLVPNMTYQPLSIQMFKWNHLQPPLPHLSPLHITLSVSHFVLHQRRWCHLSHPLSARSPISGFLCSDSAVEGVGGKHQRCVLHRQGLMSQGWHRSPGNRISRSAPTEPHS